MNLLMVLCLRALIWILKRSTGSCSVSYCANRVTKRWETPAGHEVTLILRDTRQPDGFSRTELYQMLKTLRDHERAQGWKCPEPYPFDRIPGVGYRRSQ